MTGWAADAALLARRIARFVDESLGVRGTTSESFEAVVLAVHAYQLANDPLRARLVDGEVTEIEDMPFLPVGLFKEIAVGTVAPNDAAICFRTSGTTTGGRGVHAMRSDALLVHQARAWADRCVPSRPTRGVALLEDAADSSLGHMVRHLCDEVSWHVTGGRLDTASLDPAVASGPTFVATTGFSLAAWLDRAVVPRLPAGSVLMVTGGFKGRVVGLDPQTLLDEAHARLAPHRLVVEYGMTELSSQLWGTAEPGVKGVALKAPPWLRVLPIDAAGAAVPPKTTGQLRFIDLCNLDSAVAIETMDQGVLAEDGTLTLLGRLPEADLRGCSLPYEAAVLATRAGVAP